jgi:hypothetical protein
VGRPMQAERTDLSAAQHLSRNSVSFAWVNQPQEHLANGDLSTDNGFAFTASHALNHVLDIDGSVLVLPGGDEINYQDGGTETEGFLGVKVGLRREHYGLFVKARPGFSTFPHTYSDGLTYPPPNVPGYDFSADVGAVLEVYPTNKHLLFRSDFGNVLTYYHAVAVTTPSGVITQSATGKASVLFMIGAGWRF